MSDPATLAPAAVLDQLRAGAHGAVRLVARDVWPSFSGTDEVVEIFIRPAGAAWAIQGEVVPDQFGVRAEVFQATLSDAQALDLLRRTQASDGPSLRWA